MNTRVYNTTNFKLPSADPFFIGLDSMLSKLNNTAVSGNYPPYNLVKTGEYTYEVEIAVAGFDEDQLSIATKDGMLTITGNSPEPQEDKTYIYRGLAARSFARTFTLADSVEVVSAELTNGILVICLEKVVPDANKEKKILISTPKKAELLTE